MESADRDAVSVPVLVLLDPATASLVLQRGHTRLPKRPPPGIRRSDWRAYRASLRQVHAGRNRREKQLRSSAPPAARRPAPHHVAWHDLIRAEIGTILQHHLCVGHVATKLPVRVQARTTTNYKSTD